MILFGGRFFWFFVRDQQARRARRIFEWFAFGGFVELKFGCNWFLILRLSAFEGWSLLGDSVLMWCVGIDYCFYIFVWSFLFAEDGIKWSQIRHLDSEKNIIFDIFSSLLKECWDWLLIPLYYCFDWIMEGFGLLHEIVHFSSSCLLPNFCILPLYHVKIL